MEIYIHTYIHIFYEERLEKPPYICVYMCAYVWWFCKPFFIENFPSLKCREYQRRGQREHKSQRMGGMLRNAVAAVYMNSHSWANLHKTCTRWNLLRFPAWSWEGFLWPHPLTEKLLLADGSWGRQCLFSLDYDCWLVAHALVAGWLYTHVHMGRVIGHSRL